MKGASQVDWAISMGLFLIYVLGLIVFLRPGLQPVLENDLLLSVVKNNLEKDVNVKIQKIPLFINISDYTKQSPPNSGVYKIEVNDPLPFEGQESEFAILDNENRFVNFDLTGDKKLRFDGEVVTNKMNIFWILFFDNNTYNNQNPTQSVSINNEKNFSYSYGVTEEIRGFSYNNLLNLEQNISKLKQNWNFPIDKDFSISLINTTNSQYNQTNIIFSYNQKESLQQTDVYVKEWKSWIINEKAELYGVILNVRVGEFEQ
ncbi:hypothetical protein HYX15_02815 [Candidatus Woesearchaeota archaeon]|nr:hypothetical protein [Candidatus Woesearchaeota archaeon]